MPRLASEIETVDELERAAKDWDHLSAIAASEGDVRHADLCSIRALFCRQKAREMKYDQICKPGESHG